MFPNKELQATVRESQASPTALAGDDDTFMVNPSISKTENLMVLVAFLSPIYYGAIGLVLRAIGKIGWEFKDNDGGPTLGV